MIGEMASGIKQFGSGDETKRFLIGKRNSVKGKETQKHTVAPVIQTSEHPPGEARRGKAARKGSLQQ